MSTTFSVNSGDIVNAALRALGVIGSGETASSDDLTNCIQALNIMVKNWGINGMELWKVRELVITTVAGQATYTIGPTATGAGAVVGDRPMRVVSAYIRDTTSNSDWTLQVVSRQEYDKLGNKTSAGIPNQLYYDPQLANGVLYVYNVPNDATHEMHLICHYPVSDIASSTDTFDFPQEWYQALKWGLMDEVGPEYGATPMIMQMAAAKANAYREKLVDWSVEEASTFFQPSSRFGRQ